MGWGVRNICSALIPRQVAAVVSLVPVYIVAWAAGRTSKAGTEGLATTPPALGTAAFTEEACATPRRVTVEEKAILAAE